MSKSLLFTLFSDLHLGVHQNSEYWLGEGVKWAKWFASENDRLKNSRVVFAGDFYHYRDEISLRALDTASKINGIFAESGIRDIFSIPGNHDCLFRDNADIHSLSTLKEPFRIIENQNAGQPLKFGNRLVCFVPWGSPVPEGKYDIIIGHFDTVGFEMQRGRLADRGYNPHDIISKAPLVFSGHYHLMQEKTYPGGERFIYAGNPFQMDMGDRNSKKGYWKVFDDLSTEFVEYNDGPKHVMLDVSKEDWKSKEYGENVILKVVVDGTKSSDENNRAIEEAVAFINPRIHSTDAKSTVSLTPIEGISIQNNGSVEDLFSEYIASMPITDMKKESVSKYISDLLINIK